MKTEQSPKYGMFPAERSQSEMDACSRDQTTNGFLPAGVVQVPKDELQRFLKCKRVGNYLLGKTIGEGSFAKVKQGFHVLAGEKVRGTVRNPFRPSYSECRTNTYPQNSLEINVTSLLNI